MRVHRREEQQREDVAPWSPGDAGRTWWHADRLNDLSQTTEHLVAISPEAAATANLVSSRCRSGAHAPAIDVDFPAHLVPSSTPGHAHLYIDKHLTWRQYRALLWGLYRSGLIDQSVLWRSVDRQATYLRPPGVVKTDVEVAAGSISAPPNPRAARAALRRVQFRVVCRTPWWGLTALLVDLCTPHHARRER